MREGTEGWWRRIWIAFPAFSECLEQQTKWKRWTGLRCGNRWRTFGKEKVLYRLRKRAVFLTSKNDGSGDPLQILMDYVRMVFHVDILTYNNTLKEVKGKTDAIMLLLDSMGN